MKQYIEKSLDFNAYLALVDKLLEAGLATGTNQAPSYVEFSRLNRRRMQRLAATIAVTEKARRAIQENERQMIWLVITEGWCGDAAQNIPVIEKIAAESGKIETRYILRDDNVELIEMFLTDGARAIPKLIALDAKTFEVLGTWGARPAAAQQLFRELKEKGMEKASIMESLQRWYNADKGRSLQEEFVRLIDGWQPKATLAARA